MVHYNTSMDTAGRNNTLYYCSVVLYVYRVVSYVVTGEVFMLVCIIEPTGKPIQTVNGACVHLNHSAPLKLFEI
jgi:hypothetical protein